MKRWRGVILAILMTGCASSHNLRTEGDNPWGGGFVDEEVLPGFHRLTAIGNATLWASPESARRTWRNRADQLCGKDAYQEIAVDSAEGKRDTTSVVVLSKHYAPIFYAGVEKYNTSMHGYILCNSSELSIDAAIAYLHDTAETAAKALTLEHEKELAEMADIDCENSETAASAENYFRRGKKLMALNEYKAALNCFLRAQATEKDTSIYRQSCSAIGTLYELGWGVEKDMPTAQSWYRKAGF